MPTRDLGKALIEANECISDQKCYQMREAYHNTKSYSVKKERDYSHKPRSLRNPIRLK